MTAGGEDAAVAGGAGGPLAGAVRAGTTESDPDVVLDDERREVLLRHARVIAAGGDPDTPLTAAHAFRPPPGLSPAQGLGLLAAMLVVLLSGFASGSAVDAIGVRAFSLLMLGIAWGAARGLASGTAAVVPDGDGARLAPTRFEKSLLLGALVVASLTASATVLALLPAVVHGVVARILLASTTDAKSLIEKAARISHPLAPAFIGPYCRRLTTAWGLAFAASAGLTAVLALAGETAAHRAWTGWLFWALLGLFGAAEFFWRKAWFRYFGKGPFDRFLARLFPPERTARGRRSQDYLMRMRAELARLAEIERQAARGA